MKAGASGTEGGGRAPWGTAAVLALAVHLGLAAIVLAHDSETLEGAPSNAITVDLTPEPSASERAEAGSGPPAPEPVAASDDVAETAASEPPSEAAPPPAPEPSTAETMEAPEVPPPPPLETAVTLPRAEKKPEQKKHEKTPPRPAALASSAAAPTVAAGGGRPSAARIATWKSELALRLATRKRYPAEAQVRQQQGVALLRFTVDGAGRVVSRALVKSSGVASLDEETLTLVNRAGPFPPPPPGMPIPVEISVPVRFSIK